MKDNEACAADDTLAGARAGDSAAFTAIVRAHQRSVYSLALRMLLDRHKAEDLAQEVFLQLHSKLATIESDAHLAFWLRKITTHRAIDRLRQEPKREVGLLEAEELAAEVNEDDPLLQRQLRVLVSELPTAARAVVLLRYQEDLDPMEIANTLDMPINTVKSHLKRSLVALRERVLAAGIDHANVNLQCSVAVIKSESSS